MKRFQKSLTTFVLAACLAGGAGLVAAAPAAAACGITSISNVHNSTPGPSGLWTLKVNYTNCGGSAIKATLLLTDGTRMAAKVVSPYGSTSWTYHTPTKMGVNRVTYTVA